MKPRSQEPGNQNLIGSKVVEIRNEQNMKQKELLTKLQLAGINITSSSLSRLEGQYRKACDYEMCAVAEALGVNELYLLGKTQEK